MAGNRPQRIAELVHADLAKLIRNEVKDPRVGMVSITHVKVTGDLRMAFVHVTPLGGLGDGQEMLEGLQAAAPYLRRLLGKTLRLRHTLALEFRLDDGVDEAVRMTAMLNKMADARVDSDKEASSEGEE